MEIFIVFEKSETKFRQLSCDMGDEESAKSFIETMKEGYYYKAYPEIELLYAKIEID